MIDSMGYFGWKLEHIRPSRRGNRFGTAVNEQMFRRLETVVGAHGNKRRIWDREHILCNRPGVRLEAKLIKGGRKVS
jgi:hypothetical protein